MFARLNERRQIANDIQVRLQAAQHKWSHQIAQLLRAIAIAMALDWNGEAALKIRKRSKVARRAEFHDRPQLGQTIFNRRTRQRNAMVRLNGANGRSLLGGRILNVLRFVKSNAAPRDLLQVFLITGNQGVRGDDNIGFLRHFLQLFALWTIKSVMNMNG